MSVRKKKPDKESFHLKQITVNTILFAVFSLIIVLILFLNYRIGAYDDETRDIMAQIRTAGDIRTSVMTGPSARGRRIADAISVSDVAALKEELDVPALEMLFSEELGRIEQISGIVTQEQDLRIRMLHEDLMRMQNEAAKLALVSHGLNAEELNKLDNGSFSTTLSGNAALDEAVKIIYGSDYTMTRYRYENAVSDVVESAMEKLNYRADYTEEKRAVHEPVQFTLIILSLLYLAMLFDIIYKYYDVPVLEYTKAVRKYRCGTAMEIKPQGINEVYQLGVAMRTISSAADTEMTSVKERLAESETELNEAYGFGRAKVSFLRALCSEIHSQLNTLVGYEYLLRHTKLDDNQKKCSEQIGKSAGSLMELIGNVRTFAKLDSVIETRGQLKFALDDVLSSAAEDVRLVSDPLNVNVEYSIDGNIPKQLYGDSVKLVQCIVNVISAAAYLSDSKTVSFSAVCEMSGKEKNVCRINFFVRDSESRLDNTRIAYVTGVSATPELFACNDDSVTSLRLAVASHLSVLLGGRFSANVNKGAGEIFFSAMLGIGSSDAIGSVTMNDSTLYVAEAIDEMEKNGYSRCIDVDEGIKKYGRESYLAMLAKFASVDKNDSKYIRTLINSKLIGNATKAAEGLSRSAERIFCSRITADCTAVLRELSEPEVNTFIIFKLLTRLDKNMEAVKASINACNELYVSNSAKPSAEILSQKAYELLAAGKPEGIFYFEECSGYLRDKMLPVDMSSLEKAAYAYSLSECASILRSQPFIADIQH